MIDLWPDDIENNTSVKAPVTILKEQGVLLGRKMGNAVKGEVADSRSGLLPRDHFGYSFYIVGPALGDYHYQLLHISHSIDLYPLNIVIGEDVLGELPADIKDEDSKLTADSEDRFMEILKAIFATKKVRKVIGAILAQSGVSIES